VKPADVLQRRLSQLRHLYADSAAVEAILSSEGDRLIYEVHNVPLPEDAGHVLHCTTIIFPGTVGGECHMTKGHYHARRDTGEVYVGLAGEGEVLMQLESGAFKHLPLRPGVAAYIPPFWGHRTVNTGSEPFIFFSAWPGDAGHDYAAIEQHGFAMRVLQGEAGVTFVPNPAFTAR